MVRIRFAAVKGVTSLPSFWKLINHGYVRILMTEEMETHKHSRLLSQPTDYLVTRINLKQGCIREHLRGEWEQNSGIKNGKQYTVIDQRK